MSESPRESESVSRRDAAFLTATGALGSLLLGSTLLADDNSKAQPEVTYKGVQADAKLKINAVITTSSSYSRIVQARIDVEKTGDEGSIEGIAIDPAGKEFPVASASVFWSSLKSSEVIKVSTNSFSMYVPKGWTYVVKQVGSGKAKFWEIEIR